MNCTQQYLFDEVQNYILDDISYPTCKNLMDWGIQSYMTCFYYPDHSKEYLQFNKLSENDLNLVKEIINEDLWK